MRLTKIQAILALNKAPMNLSSLKKKLAETANISIASSYRIIDELFIDGYIAKSLEKGYIELQLSPIGLSIVKKLKEV